MAAIMDAQTLGLRASTQSAYWALRSQPRQFNLRQTAEVSRTFVKAGLALDHLSCSCAAAAFACGLARAAFQRKRRRGAVRQAAVIDQALAPARTKNVDNAGRHWETTVSRIGPPLTSASIEAADTLPDRWRIGSGNLRVACYDASRITCMALSQETLCFGNTQGLVRTVDIQSGDIVGEYYLGSHMPSCVSALHFDGSAVVAGTRQGEVFVWRAQLPGSWGYSSIPEWTLSHGGRSNECEVTGLALAGDSLLTSSMATFAKADKARSDASKSTVVSPLQRWHRARGAARGKDAREAVESTGIVSFWDLSKAQEERVQPMCSVDFASPVLCLCSAGSEGVFAGLADGSLYKVMADGKKRLLQDPADDRQPNGNAETNAVTALAFDGDSKTLLVGREDGRIAAWQPDQQEHPEYMPAFHKRAVKHLTWRQAPPDGLVIFVSTGDDGRVGVWEKSGKDVSTLWALRCLHPQSLVAVADSDRLLTSGVVINPCGGANLLLRRTWRDPEAVDTSTAPACEAVLCMDLKRGSSHKNI